MQFDPLAASSPKTLDPEHAATHQFLKDYRAKTDSLIKTAGTISPEIVTVETKGGSRATYPAP